MKCIILAGGFATRLWPITSNKPKPILPLGDRPLIQHIIDAIPKDIGIIISTNEQFAHSFDQIVNNNSRLIHVFVEPSAMENQKRGTIAAISDSIHEYGQDDYLIVGGDNYFDFSISEFIETSLKRPNNPCIVAYDVQNKIHASKFGVVEVDGEKILGFEEKPKEPKSTLVSTLCYFFPENVLDYVHEASKTISDEAGKLFPFFMDQKQTDCFAFTASGVWSDIGSFYDYIATHKQLQCQSVSEKLREGNKIEGSVFISEDAKVKNSTIIDSIILGDSQIKDSYIEGCIINEGVIVNGNTLIGQSVANNIILD